ncbi:MAG TPA: ABC transporter permease [Ignavibacteriaceae bacterium]|nr:ABC transporter permease [Ignavibacteriaceae bacterium]
MTRFQKMIFGLQEFSLLIKDIFAHLGSVKDNWSETIQEMYLIGTKSFFLIFLGGLFTGIILAIETGHQLETFGATAWIAKTVSLGMVRELGPVIAGLLLAARTGAKNTSELGAMQLSEQIDALRAFGASPIEKLVIPRTIAALVMFLPLTLIADIVGILGGMLVSNQTFHSDISVFWNTAVTSLKMKDLFVGFLKPIFFGFFIATISCYFGLTTKGGTTGLGKNTINAVVYSSALILVIDFIFTKVVWELL